MTDAELLEIVQSRSPDELTPAEVAVLCERVEQSPALRQALAESLEMERYFADVLGRVAIAPEQILARSEQNAPRPRVRRLSRSWIALSLLVVAALGAALTWKLMKHPTTLEPTRTVAQKSPEIVAVTTPEEPRPQSVEPTPPQPDPKVEVLPSDDPIPAVATPHDSVPEPFTPVPQSEPGLTEAELQTWFEPVAGQAYAFKKLPGDHRTVASATALTGLMRLRNFGKPGSALRCSFRTTNAFKLHFWKGRAGVTLERWQGFVRIPDIGSGWIAYRTTRTGQEPRPATLALTATDEQRYARTWVGRDRLFWTSPQIPVDLRYEDGMLIVSSGDIRLLTVPFAEPPDEIFFEGTAVIHRLGLVPAIPLMPLPRPAPIVFETDKPADLKWLGTTANLTRRPDGSVELTAANAPQRAWIATPLPPHGICEVIVQLADATPNCTIYLGDEQGNVLYGTTIRRDATSGQPLLLEADISDISTTVKFDPLRWPPGYVGDKLWVRMLLTSGQLKCWTSTDGVNWGRAFEPILEHKAHPYSSVGISCQAGLPRCAARLCRLEVREYRTLNSMAPPDLVQQAPLLHHDPRTTMNDWLAAARAARPKDIEEQVWARACALRGLASGAGPVLKPAVLESLVEYGLGQPSTLETRLRLVDEAMLVLPKCKEVTAERFMHFYERIGEELRHAGEARPYSRVRQRMFQAPIWTTKSFAVVPEKLAAAELLDLVQAGLWKEVAALCRATRIYRRSPNLFDWGALQAARHENHKPLASVRWQSPAILEIDKDGANDLGELDAAVRNQDYGEACVLLTRRNTRGPRGLLPDSSDEQRLVSWPLALNELMHAHPELRATLRDKFAPQARLQLRRALDENDAAALELLADQFHGTEEAGAAHLWLGDRLLLEGEPARAVQQYRQALHMTEGIQRARLDDRLELAAALLGQPVAVPPTADLTFGDTHLSPTQLQELRQKRHADGIDSRWTSLLPPQLAPAPSVFESVVRGHLAGEPSHPTKTTFYLAPTQLRVLDNLDWFERNSAAAVADNRLVVCNRSGVDCFELPAGKLQWHTTLPRDSTRAEGQRPTFDCPLVPLRPVISGPRIFVRQQRPGPSVRVKDLPLGVTTLACLNLDDGKVLWNTINHRAGKLQYVSDPVVIQDQVYVVAERLSSDSDRALLLLIHDPRTGVLLAERPLIRLQSEHSEQRSCQLTALEDGCIATVGGAVIRFDLAGNLRWARRQFWVPPDFDNHWLAQYHEPPLVAAGRCYIVQPGVFSILCLDPKSGRQQWSRGMPGLQRIAGLVDGKLVVQTDAALVCLAAATGKELWRHETAALLSAPLCGGPHGLMLCVRDPISEDGTMARPCLIWIDLETGRESTRCPLDSLRHQKPHLGPIFSAGDRLWAFSGKGEDLARDLLELVPKSPLPNSP